MGTRFRELFENLDQRKISPFPFGQHSPAYTKCLSRQVIYVYLLIQHWNISCYLRTLPSDTPSPTVTAYLTYLWSYIVLLNSVIHSERILCKLICGSSEDTYSPHARGQIPRVVWSRTNATLSVSRNCDYETAILSSIKYSTSTLTPSVLQI